METRLTWICRVRDWLYGIRHAEPEPASSSEPSTEAERLRVINHMITSSAEDGGAGITPQHGEWKNVTAVFPLHDEETNKKWMREWSQKTFLSDEDLDQIRDKFGESVCVQHLCVSGVADRRAGRVLLFFPAIILPIPDLPGCFWFLMLVLLGRLLHCLHSGQQPLVHHLC